MGPCSCERLRNGLLNQKKTIGQTAPGVKRRPKSNHESNQASSKAHRARRLPPTATRPATGGSRVWGARGNPGAAALL